MAQRARKKRRSGGGASGRPAPEAEPHAGGAREAMDARTATAATDDGPAREATDDAAPTTAGGYYARQRARDEAARASLEPLAPGERPRAVTVAAVLAGVVAAGNLLLLAGGWRIEGREPQAASTIVFAAVMALGAAAIWRRKYWAVLAFQALLAITVLFAFLALLTASDARGALLCVAIILVGSTLFWHLVRAMARLQLPDRPTS